MHRRVHSIFAAVSLRKREGTSITNTLIMHWHRTLKDAFSALSTSFERKQSKLQWKTFEPYNNFCTTWSYKTHQWIWKKYLSKMKYSNSIKISGILKKRNFYWLVVSVRRSWCCIFDPIMSLIIFAAHISLAVNIGNARRARFTQTNSVSNAVEHWTKILLHDFRVYHSGFVQRI